MFKYIIIFSFFINFSAISYAEEFESWEVYYKNTITKSVPRRTLWLAQEYFQLENKRGGRAADLGAGTGRDTLFLLQKGWNVLAIDAEQLSIDIILNRVDASYLDNLAVVVSPFSEMILPPELDLIFGEKDAWAIDHPELTFHSYEKMLQLFEGRFVIEYLQIDEGLIPCTIKGEIKHCHIYHVVAKKIRD